MLDTRLLIGALVLAVGAALAVALAIKRRQPLRVVFRQEETILSLPLERWRSLFWYSASPSSWWSTTDDAVILSNLALQRTDRSRCSRFGRWAQPL